MRETLQLAIGLLAGPSGLMLFIVGGIAYLRDRCRRSVPAFGLVLLSLFALTLAMRWRTIERWFDSL
jgi:hypothetical protein